MKENLNSPDLLLFDVSTRITVEHSFSLYEDINVFYFKLGWAKFWLFIRKEGKTQPGIELNQAKLMLAIHIFG